MLHLEYNFVWCFKLDSTENRSEILGKFENLVLEKDREISWTYHVRKEVLKELRRREISYKG